MSELHSSMGYTHGTRELSDRGDAGAFVFVQCVVSWCVMRDVRTELYRAAMLDKQMPACP